MLNRSVFRIPISKREEFLRELTKVRPSFQESLHSVHEFAPKLLNRAQDVQLCTSEELHMVIVWPEAERDIDPTGCIRDAVRAGQVTKTSVDAFVAREIAENTQLCCSSDQLRDYVLALMANGERAASV